MPSSAVTQIKEIVRTIRVLIADDNAVIRRMVRLILEQHPHYQVCGEAHNGREAIEQATRLKPDVIVLNISMPVLSGFEAASEIRATLPETAIVILSSNADQRFIDKAKQIGARAYVVKEKTGDDLVKAIEAAVMGGEFVSVD